MTGQAFFVSALTSKAAHAPLEGITQGGYALVYSEKPSGYERLSSGETAASTPIFPPV